jgi:CRISPR-associated endonuclease/helicase Cas3
MFKVFDFGRVFFPKNKPEEIIFQPLGNHVSNVRKLVNYWDWESDDSLKDDLQESRRRVSEAALLHDVGKPQRFSLSVKISKAGKFDFSYSFSGHRYLASKPEKPWIEYLAKGHHDFSANDICRDTYKLKTLLNKLDEKNFLKSEAEKYKHILELEPLTYAHELYILEMCDQIEAELACRFFDDDKQAESRAFMDFTITKEKGKFFLDPWIFGNKQAIKLTFASWTMPFPDKIKIAIEKGLPDVHILNKELNKAVKEWWQSQPNKLKSKTDTVIIYRLPSDNLEKIDTISLYQIIGNFSPNPMQQDLAESLNPELNPHPAILSKAPTGSGKTESILFPALAQDYRLFLVLPTRSLLEDQKERINEYLLRFSNLEQNRGKEISLVVDTGAQMDRWIYKDGQVSKPKVKPRRHLYKGNVILTTLDKFLYRYFAFGDRQKSFIFPHRIHFSKSLICFDEAHSYDDIAFTNFCSLVKSLYEAGRSIVLMTATMPNEYLKNLDYLETIDYIDDLKKSDEFRKFQEQILKQDYPNKKALEWISNIERNSEQPEIFHNEFAQVVIREWRAKHNRKIIAVVERVTDAAAIYQRVNQQFTQEISERFLFLYHGRIADQLRPDIYKQIQERDSKNQPYILITTSAIEVGCDLNAEVLISEICPPENLIQRAGRCNRKGNISDAKVIMIGNSIPDFANTLDESGWQEYQKTLKSLQEFDTQKITNCISVIEQVDDYRVVELFSMLHDYVYSADLTCKHAHEKGLIITRSWTPSATLIYKDGGDKPHTITVPIDRLIRNKNGDNDFANTYALEYWYNQETTRGELRDLSWGDAYSKDIVIEIHKNGEGAGTYDGKDEYEYNQDLGFIKLPGVFIKPRVNNNEIQFEEKLLYKDSNNKSVIIKYIKALRIAVD